MKIFESFKDHLNEINLGGLKKGQIDGSKLDFTVIKKYLDDYKEVWLKPNLYLSKSGNDYNLHSGGFITHSNDKLESVLNPMLESLKDDKNIQKLLLDKGYTQKGNTFTFGKTDIMVISKSGEIIHTHYTPNGRFLWTHTYKNYDEMYNSLNGINESLKDDRTKLINLLDADDTDLENIEDVTRKIAKMFNVKDTEKITKILTEYRDKVDTKELTEILIKKCL